MAGEYTPARRRSARRTRGGRANSQPTEAQFTENRFTGDRFTEDQFTGDQPNQTRFGQTQLGQTQLGQTRSEQAAQEQDPEACARQICLQQLTLAPKTRAQLKTALSKKGIPDDVADAVLGRFAEVGLIDDAAFARAWVESRHYSKGLAGRALSAELRRRGVEDDEIREAVAALDPDAEVETARRLVERKLSSTRGQPAQVRTRKLAGMLARKGYPAGLAFRVIREALEAEGADVTLGDEPPDDPVDDDFDRYTD
jgi:regulatory protein